MRVCLALLNITKIPDIIWNTLQIQMKIIIFGLIHILIADIIKLINKAKDTSVNFITKNVFRRKSTMRIDYGHIVPIPCASYAYFLKCTHLVTLK